MKRLVKKTKKVKEALRKFFSRYYADEKRIEKEILFAEIYNPKVDKFGNGKLDVFQLSSGSVLVGSFEDVCNHLLSVSNGCLYYCSEGKPYLFFGYQGEKGDFCWDVLRLEKYLLDGHPESIVWATSIKAYFDCEQGTWKKGEYIFLCIQDAHLQCFDRFVDKESINALPHPEGWGTYCLCHEETAIDSGHLVLV